MPNLTSERKTREYLGNTFSLLAGEQIYAGAMVAVNASGKAVQATKAGNPVIGVALHSAANGEPVAYRRGVFAFDNAATTPVTSSAIGGTCHVADDHTVDATSGSAVAGTVLGFEEDQVIVKIQ